MSRSILQSRALGLILISTFMTMGQSIYAAAKLGFKLDNATIPVADIRAGGPPRDGIPSIDRPKFVPAAKVRFLAADDMVVSFTHQGETRAYPLRILVWHEIVNDRIGDLAINVSYCPLCGSAMVFDRTIGGRTLEFGVSGLLYQSDVLMYDRRTESLWSQLEMTAVSGTEVGRQLRLLPAQHLTWQAWRAEHPDGLVLSTDTGLTKPLASPLAMVMPLIKRRGKLGGCAMAVRCLRPKRLVALHQPFLWPDAAATRPDHQCPPFLP